MYHNRLDVPGLSANLARESESYGDDLRLITFRQGETIYTPMSGNQAVYLLIEGEVRLYRLGSDDRRFTLATLRPGSAFGQASLLGNLEFETFAEATQPSTIWMIADRRAHEIFSRNINLSLSLLAGLSQRLVDVEARLESMAYKKVPARLAALLLQMVDEKSGMVLGLTHQYLAEMLGTYRETVSQALRDFRSKGLVTPGRKKIAVVDADGLKKIAEQAD